MPAANKPIKPMRIKVFCLAKVMTAHGFTGNALGGIIKINGEKLVFVTNIWYFC
jgi:hypothetical protein